MVEPRVLLNAEPFGFGPAAFTARLAPALRPHVAALGYAGVGHTLDLQQGLPYTALHNMTGVPLSAWAPVFARYDVLVTALDDAVARAALARGLRVVFWDPLVGYWPRLPVAPTHPGVLYLVQRFFGVEERLALHPLHAANARLVPLLAPPALPRVPGNLVFVNFGGLANPAWGHDTPAAYARAVLGALDAVLPAGVEVVAAANRSVAAALNDPRVACRDAAAIDQLLARAAAAFMTPGLGNMTDAARVGVPTLWLPPANDSQAQQLAHLHRAGLSDAHILWEDLGLDVDFAAPQPQVLSALESAVHRLACPDPQLATALQRLLPPLINQPTAAVAGLLTLFGAGGTDSLLAPLLSWFNQDAAPCPTSPTFLSPPTARRSA